VQALIAKTTNAKINIFIFIVVEFIQGIPFQSINIRKNIDSLKKNQSFVVDFEI